MYCGVVMATTDVCDTLSGYKDASQKGKEWRYHMPDENRGKEVDKYGEADEKEAAPGYEQKQWEEKHTAAGTLRFGAKDAKEKNAVKEKQYDILLDDEIEFIQVLYAYFLLVLFT